MLHVYSTQRDRMTNADVKSTPTLTILTAKCKMPLRNNLRSIFRSAGSIKHYEERQRCLKIRISLVVCAFSMTEPQ